MQSCQNRPAEFARCPRCPPGACQRRLLPLPVFVTWIFRCFLVQAVNFILYGVCKLVNKAPLKRVTPHGVGRCPQGRGDRSVRGGPPLGGGGIRPRSATSSVVMSKPSGGIRSLPSLSAWGLPTPVVALAGIGNVIFRCFLVQAGDFYFYGVCKFVFLGSPLGHPKGVPCAELSPQVTEGLPATAINRFHKELRFFFSLLKRKKEAKKEKSSRFTCVTRSNITRRLHKKLPSQILTNKNPPAGHTGGCRRRNTTLFTVEIGA